MHEIMKALYDKWGTLLCLMRQKRYYEILEGILNTLKIIGIHIQANDFFVSPTSYSQLPLRLPGLSFRPVKDDEIDILTSIEGKDTLVFRERIEDWGDECRGLFFQKRLVGYAWLSKTKMRVPEIGYERRLKANEIYLYNGVIEKELRTWGFFGIFLMHLVREAGTNGSIIINTVEFTNNKSKQTFLKMGFRKTGTYTYVTLWNLLKFHFKTSHLPEGKEEETT
jgi:hypothetical protein